MRFVFYIWLTILSAIFAAHLSLGYAQSPSPAQSSFETYNLDLTQAPSQLKPRLQKGQRAHQLKTADGLIHKRFARRLGQISAIARGRQGKLYIADANSGRIFILSDKDYDDKPEKIRPLPYRFDAPSAVFEQDGIVYIADRQAIWTYKPNEAPRKLASLANIDSTRHYVLSGKPPISGTQNRKQASNRKNSEVNSNVNAEQNPLAETIIFGYTSKTSQAHLLSIDVKTGTATLTAQANGHLLALTPNINGAIWSALQTQDGVIIGPSLKPSTQIASQPAPAGLALTPRSIAPDDWPNNLRDHVLIARNHPVDITALPTSLGVAMPKGQILFSGFQDGRTAWGQMGALLMDPQGLFIADPYNGDLWLIRPKREVIKAPDSALKSAINKIKRLEQDAEIPLKRDPLDNIYESLFPDPKTSASNNTVKTDDFDNTDNGE